MSDDKNDKRPDAGDERTVFVPSGGTMPPAEAEDTTQRSEPIKPKKGAKKIQRKAAKKPVKAAASRKKKAPKRSTAVPARRRNSWPPP